MGTVKCLNSGWHGCTENARVPVEQPTFCSDTCAAQFARAQWSWCEKHEEWWDVERGCKACEKRRQASSLRSQARELNKRADELEKK